MSPDAGPFEFAFDIASPKLRFAPPPMFGEPGGPATGSKVTVVLNTGNFFGGGSTSANGITQPAGGFSSTTDVVLQYPAGASRNSFSNTQVLNCRSLRLIGGKHVINPDSNATPLRLFAQQSIFVEGFEIDGQGANADCFNGGGPAQPDIYLQNVWFHNVQGTQATVHADALQPQTATGVIYLDRFSGESGYQVLYLPPLDGPIEGLVASRCDLRFRAGGPTNSVAFWPSHCDQLMRSAGNPTAVWAASKVYPVELTEFYAQPRAGQTLSSCLFPTATVGWADGTQSQPATINNQPAGLLDTGLGDGSRTWPAAMKVTGRVRAGVPGPGPVAAGGFWKASNVGIGYTSPGYQSTGITSIVYTDVRPGTVTASGTKTESKRHSGSRTGTVTASGTRSDLKRYTDARSGAITVSGSKTESAARTFTDSRTGTVHVSGTASDSWSRTLLYQDTPSPGIARVTGTKTESYSRTFTDSRSGTVTASGQGSESYDIPDIYTDVPLAGQVVVSGSGSESFSTDFVDSQAGSTSVDGTGSDSWEQGLHYNDTPSPGVVQATGSTDEAYEASLSLSGTVEASGEGMESWDRGGDAEGVTTVSGEGVEGRVFDDAAEAFVTASGSGTESSVQEPAPDGLIVMTGEGAERFHRRRDPVGRLELVLSSDTRSD